MRCLSAVSDVLIALVDASAEEDDAAFVCDLVEGILAIKRTCIQMSGEVESLKQDVEDAVVLDLCP